MVWKFEEKKGVIPHCVQPAVALIIRLENESGDQAGSDKRERSRHGVHHNLCLRSNGKKAVLSSALCAGSHRHHAWRRGRLAVARFRHHARSQGARRRFHKTDQDDDRPDHLLYRRVRHRSCPGRGQGRTRRRQGPDLFRGRLDFRAGDRSGHRQCAPAGRGFFGHARRRRRRQICRRRQAAQHRRFPARRHSGFTWSAPSPRATSCRCCYSPS